MKKFRRITTLLLAVMLIAAMCVPAYADNGMTRAVIGADLNEDQVAAVYQAFGVERGSCIEMKVTNAEERQYLEGYVDSSLIGTRSISSVYVQLLSDGSGMDRHRKALYTRRHRHRRGRRTAARHVELSGDRHSPQT